MTKFLKKYSNKIKEFGSGFERYFEMYYNEETKTFMFPLEKAGVIEDEMDLYRYFVIVTSEKMMAKE